MQLEQRLPRGCAICLVSVGSFSNALASALSRQLRSRQFPCGRHLRLRRGSSSTGPQTRDALPVCRRCCTTRESSPSRSLGGQARCRPEIAACRTPLARPRSRGVSEGLPALPSAGASMSGRISVFPPGPVSWAALAAAHFLAGGSGSLSACSGQPDGPPTAPPVQGLARAALLPTSGQRNAAASTPQCRLRHLVCTSRFPRSTFPELCESVVWPDVSCHRRR